VVSHPPIDQAGFQEQRESKSNAHICFKSLLASQYVVLHWPKHFIVKPRVSADATRQILQEGVVKLGLLLQSVSLRGLNKSGSQDEVPILTGISPGLMLT